MKIIKFQAENVKRLEVVEIEPDGSLIIIGGKNEAGKSSILDCIEMAMKGKSAIPDEPLKRGAKKGHIVLELDNITVTRTFEKDGKTKLIVTPRGKKIRQASPQTMLDSLYGSLSFDPVAFESMKPADKLAQLKKLLGLDFSLMEKLKAKVFEQRTGTNREVNRLLSLIEAKTHHPNAPKKVVSISDLTDEQRIRREVNQGNKSIRDRLDLSKTSVTTADTELGIIERNIEKLQQQLSQAKQLVESRTTTRESLTKQVDKLQDRDEQEITDQLATVEQTNQQVRENQEIAELNEEYEQALQKADGQTATLKKFDLDKKNQIAQAKFPIDGLGFNDKEVTYNDLPFEQASGAVRLRVSIAMGIALNPELRVLLIRDGSRLDGDNLKVVAEMAEEHDMQIWLERVGDKDDCHVVIADGRVVGATPDQEPCEPGVDAHTDTGHEESVEDQTESQDSFFEHDGE